MAVLSFSVCLRLFGGGVVVDVIVCDVVVICVFVHGLSVNAFAIAYLSSLSSRVSVWHRRPHHMGHFFLYLSTRASPLRD